MNASKAEMHTDMAAQQSAMQQMQADLSIVTAARWDLQCVYHRDNTLQLGWLHAIASSQACG